MLDALLSALLALSEPDRLFYMALGVAIGYAIGVVLAWALFERVRHETSPDAPATGAAPG